MHFPTVSTYIANALDNVAFTEGTYVRVTRNIVTNFHLISAIFSHSCLVMTISSTVYEQTYDLKNYRLYAM